MMKLPEFISRHMPANADMTKKLNMVEHELAYTISSKNILTLNNHSKDRRIIELETALEEKSAKILRQQVKLLKAATLIETHKARIKTQKTLLHKLEVRVYELEDNMR
jgi:ppGpp synthetase/RelA/SpoT-type nucleotidyltranferase